MYSFDSRVRYSECDEDARLSIPALVNYLQDASTFQSESIGLGFDHMRANHYAWFIAAWQIEIEELPRFFAPITVNTWCTGYKRLLASRNFTISGRDGTPYVRADSLWFVYDTELGRPIKIPASQDAYLEDTPALDMPPTRRKLPVAGDCAKASPIVVPEQYLDTNGHVNNAQYLSMAIDALNELGIALTPRRIEVQYEQMALLGDTIVPEVYACEDGHTVRLAGDGDKTFSVVRLRGRA